jgi:hypothetical protein
MAKIKKRPVTKEVMAARKKWVKALRSGKYKQAQYALYRDGGFCCLGVACNIDAAEHGKNFPPKRCKDDSHVSYLKYSGLLPPRVANKLEISADGELPQHARLRGNSYGHLTALNDQARASFKEIALIIERQFIKGVPIKPTKKIKR